MSTTYALQLHMELKESELNSMSPDKAKILKKYGNVEKSISRDIIVPSTLALHQLHFLINVAFGWRNSHLHSFQLPQELLSELTEGKFVDIAPIFGYYLQFPNDIFDDAYWDDDYDENMSLRTWMRSKYIKNYRYGGNSEYWLENQLKLIELANSLPELNVNPFEWGKKTKPKKVKFNDATLEDLMNAIMFDSGSPECLKESLRLSEILSLDPVDIKTAKNQALSHDKSMIMEYKHYRDLVVSNYERENSSDIDGYQLYRNIDKADKIAKKAEPQNVEPITTELNYSYDYGDGWEVSIKLVREFGKDGEMVIDDKIMNVISKRKPICIAKDGLNVLDDVGGVGGYIDMLRALNKGKIDEITETKEWANSQGWTGKDTNHERMV